MKHKFTKKAVLIGFLPLIAVASYFGFSYLFSTDISFEQFTEVGDEVIVKYGPLVGEEDAKKNFHISPNVEGDLVWLEDYRELHFLPKEGFQPGQTYKVEAAVRIPFLAQASLNASIFTFTPVQFSSGSIYTPPEINDGKYIDVNLNTMQITLVENGGAVAQYPVAGKGNPWSKPTREGSFTILTKEPMHWSRLAKVWMPWSMQYSGNYFIHDWPYWPSGAPIKSTYSNGCIRMHNSDAKKVFDWAEIGMSIVVHSTPQRFAVFSGEVLQDGDLVREQNNPNVYILKRTGDKTYKRHVWTSAFGDWYAHLSPFWQRVKIVSDGTLDANTESRWIRVDASQNPDEAKYVYEINTRTRTKHKVVCGKTPLSSQQSPEFCLDAWTSYGWDFEEIFTVNSGEFGSYTEGEPVPLKQNADKLQ